MADKAGAEARSRSKSSRSIFTGHQVSSCHATLFTPCVVKTQASALPLNKYSTVLSELPAPASNVHAGFSQRDPCCCCCCFTTWCISISLKGLRNRRITILCVFPLTATVPGPSMGENNVSTMLRPPVI